MSERADKPVAPDARSTNGKSVTEPILSVQGLEKHFPVRRGLLQRQVGAVRAVDGLDFEVLAGPSPGALIVPMIAAHGKAAMGTLATEYTTGVLRTKTGVRRIATYREPRTPGGAEPSRELVFAPESLSLLEQYEHLLTQQAENPA